MLILLNVHLIYVVIYNVWQDTENSFQYMRRMFKSALLKQCPSQLARFRVALLIGVLVFQEIILKDSFVLCYRNLSYVEYFLNLAPNAFKFKSNQLFHFLFYELFSRASISIIWPNLVISWDLEFKQFMRRFVTWPICK